MQELIEYLLKHSERGACTCGKCLEVVVSGDKAVGFQQPDPTRQTIGHTADLMFFKVAAKGEPKAEELKRLIQANVQGEYGECNLFDGKEHGYMELGGWIGDQGLAMQLMGLGAILGLWQLLTPRILLDNLITDEQAMNLAGAGMVTIVSKEC